jgi:signal transduction histidine kinase
MSQVIRNLVSNALKFSSSGSKIYILAEIGDSSFRSNFFDRQNNKIQKNSLVSFVESRFGKKHMSSNSHLKDEFETSKHFSASSVVNYSRATAFGPDMDMVRVSVVDFGAGLSKVVFWYFLN